MRKSFLLLLPVLVLMMACNNNTTTTTTETPAVKADSTQPAPSATGAQDTTATDGKVDGTSTMPAQVFEELSGRPVSGATVVASDNGRSVETATTNDKGMYAYTRLTAGKSYTYTVTKTGFASQNSTSNYDGTNSLPWFALKTK